MGSGLTALEPLDDLGDPEIEELVAEFGQDIDALRSSELDGGGA